MWEMKMSFILFDRLKNSLYIQVLLLILSILICYYGLWNAYFANGDDFGITGWVMNQPTISEAVQGYGSGVRFLNYAAIWTRTRLFGLNAAPYLWSSLLHHVIVTYIFYQLVGFWTQRRSIAFLAALLFAIKFSYYEVVTSVSASDYSLWAIFYLATLALFALYLRQRLVLVYLSSVGAYILLAFAHDFTLSMPLVLLAYHLTVGRGSRPIRSIGWSDIRLHVQAFSVSFVYHNKTPLFIFEINNIGY